jgi:putative nucleotidyltransferase with HDIG domain
MLHQIPPAILDSVETIPLPPLPQVLTRFLSLLDDERTPMAELARLVSQDPALTAQFLTVAYSPAYRTGTGACSLEQCLETLGTRLLRILATCMAVQNVYARTMYERNYDFTGFWGHSLRVAELARSLAATVQYADPEEAYLAGLLHDIGQLLLLGGAGEGYGFLLGICTDEAELHGFEKTYIGTNHAILGAQLVNQWGLASFMADAVLFHQNAIEEIASTDLLSRIVWAAHHLSAQPREVGVDQLLSPEMYAVGALIGIDPAAIATACRDSHDRVAAAAASLGVDSSWDEKTLPCSTFISPDILMPKREDKDAAQAHLEGMVRNMAVMQPLQQSLFSLASEDQLFGALRESAQILFGLKRLAFLVVPPGRQVLTGAKIAGQSPLLSRLEIPLAGGPSLVAKALDEGLACASFAADPPPAALVDLQIARLLQSEGLLCIPMSSRDQRFGVMVYGLSAEQYARKQKHLDWMLSFAQVAAGCLASFRTFRDRDLDSAARLTRQFEHQARRVIHEVANPLGIINNYLAIVSQKLAAEHGVQQELDILKEEILRVERIVRRLNGLTEQPLPVETINVNSVIQGMLALYGESLFAARGIAVDIQSSPELALVRGDRDSLKQILLNLWKNSAEAMSSGGRLQLTARDMVRDGERCYVEIVVSDTGPGIPPDVMERLFQPLDPHRRPTNSGVGLSIVASLVTQLAGTITCQSTPGQGTSFTIRLPQA